jgi:acyl-CoA thioesterase-1
MKNHIHKQGRFGLGKKWSGPTHVLVTLITLTLMLNLAGAKGADPERKTIVIVGDSIAAGNGVDAAEAFPALLQERINEKKLSYEVVNAGVSGDTTAGGVRRMPWLLRRKMDVLVLELGGNDGLRGITPRETRANLEKIIDLAREKNRDVQIIVAGMQMPQNMGEEYTREFREVFPAVAKEKRTKLIPFLLEGVGGKADLNLPDRIHPNSRGHKIIAGTVWAVLEPMLAGRQKSEGASCSARNSGRFWLSLRGTIGLAIWRRDENPDGFHHSAQRCAVGAGGATCATSGQRPQTFTNPERVESNPHSTDAIPFGLIHFLILHPV